jgi:hypothetical protein
MMIRDEWILVAGVVIAIAACAGSNDSPSLSAGSYPWDCNQQHAQATIANGIIAAVIVKYDQHDNPETIMERAAELYREACP